MITLYLITLYKLTKKIKRAFLQIILLTVNVLFLCNLAYAQDVSELTVEESNQGKSLHIVLTTNELLGVETAKRYENILNLDEPISWEVYVPKNYSTENPPGLLVYISPRNSGELPIEWQELMDNNNLIWVGANESGNKIDTFKRMTYALFATNMIGKQYSVDASRIYLSGFSGGGRVASLLAADYPQIFKGAIYNSGVNKWGNMTDEKLALMQSNRYVFIAGREDFNLNDTKKIYRVYKKEGIKNIDLKIISRMGHEIPSAKNYGEAISFLDGN